MLHRWSTGCFHHHLSCRWAVVCEGQSGGRADPNRHDWCTAVLKPDKVVFARILSDNYVGVTRQGVTEHKAEVIAALKDPAASLGTWVNSNRRDRVYGDAAVVNGMATRNAPQRGAENKNRQILFTDTFVQRDGRWQCVASQATLVAAQQN